MLSSSQAVSRRALASSGGRNAVRLSRQPQRRLMAVETGPTTSSSTASVSASTPTPAAPKRSFLPRFVLYTSALGVIFYTGSTVVALNNDRYHDFFVESIPFGEAIIDYAEHNGYDRSLRSDGVKQAVEAGKGVYGHLDGVVGRTFGTGSSDTPSSPTSPRSGQAAPPGSKIAQAIKETKDRATDKAKGTAHTVVQKVQDDTAKVQQGSKVVGQEVKKDVQNAEVALSHSVKELAAEAEAAIAGKPYQKAEGARILPDTQPSRGVEFHEPVPESLPAGLKIYDKELPIGHLPPPGYILARDVKKKAPEAKAPEANSAPAPLPLVAPAISKLSSAEPVIAQLAESIDHLAGFLRDNASVVTSDAKQVLQTAEIDLVQLAKRMEKVKEEEREKLRTSLDEQAKEFNLKVLEMEADSQDKIDRQEEDWKSLFEEERNKIMSQYREKLQRELETQQELINQRLKEEVIAQGIELQRRWIREIKVRVEQERGGRLAKLEDLATNVKRLERVTLDNSSYIDENVNLHSLWSALRAVTSAVDSPKRKPFREELRVLHTVAASRADPVISAALETIEASSIPDVGVEPLADLSSWFFTSVSPKVESVSLVPDQGAGLLSHISSTVLSKFRFKPRGLVDGSDVLSVLARAEYHLNEKDLDSAARELNQLSGWPKALLTDWLAAARARLEVQQALEVIQTQAALASLLVLETK